jgi:hypothetical protein
MAGAGLDRGCLQVSGAECRVDEVVIASDEGRVHRCREHTRLLLIGTRMMAATRAMGLSALEETPWATHHEAMDSDTLQIKLEDVGLASWWARVILILTSQSGTAYMRFVGSTNGDRRYKGSTFPSCTLGTLPPQEEWAPGMTQSLEELCRELDDDGWVQVGRGTQPWAYRYQRPARGADAS